VIYQPLSRVIGHPGPSEEVRDRPGPARKVLFIDHNTPTHDQDAGSLRTFHLLDMLRRRSCHVTFLPLSLAYIDRYTRDMQRIGVETIDHRHVASVEDFLNAHAHEYSLIWICRPDVTFRLMGAVRALAPSARLVFDAIDLHSLREAREAALRDDPALRDQAERRRQQELAVIREADFSVMVSQDERRRVLERDGTADVRVIPTIHAVQPLVKPFRDRSGILFIGGFCHTPNVDAVEFFVGSIFPELRRTIPGVTFHVVGSHPPDSIRKLACEDVIVTGYVPDVSGYFRDSRLSVAPLRFGAGVKGKVNMSLAYGLPAVVSTIAAEGMHLVHGENAMIADDPSAFVAAVRQLHNSEALWSKLSANGLKNVEEHFSFEAVARELDRLLEDAGISSPKPPRSADNSLDESALVIRDRLRGEHGRSPKTPSGRE
jgi:glycosyltransferase involved in cell wall biosynthesis